MKQVLLLETEEDEVDHSVEPQNFTDVEIEEEWYDSNQVADLHSTSVSFIDSSVSSSSTHLELSVVLLSRKRKRQLND